MIPHEILSAATQIMVMAIILSVILLFVGIGLLVIVHVCIVGRAFRRGFGDVSVVERASSGNRSMSRDDLEKLPCYDYITEDTASSPVDCAVCLETFKMGEKCRLLPFCKHSFHAQCVDEWLLRTPICPICRSSADSRRGGGGGDESGCFSDISVELRGSSNFNLGESQRVESNQFSELRDFQTQESIELSVTVSESDESQTIIVGNHFNSNNFPNALPQDVPERLPV